MPMTVSPAARPGSDACRVVHQGHCISRADVQAAAGGEQQIRRRSRTQALGPDCCRVHALLDQRGESREFERLQRACARRDDGSPEAGTSGRLQVAERSGECGHATPGQRSLHCLGLSLCETTRRIRFRRPAPAVLPEGGSHGSREMRGCLRASHARRRSHSSPRPGRTGGTANPSSRRAAARSRRTLHPKPMRGARRCRSAHPRRRRDTPLRPLAVRASCC